MPYGRLKVDQLTFEDPNSNLDVNVNVSELQSNVLKAPLADPVFTGDPQAPTPATGDNDTSIATTAFVQGEFTDKIGVSVQAFDADTAKLDVAQTFVPAQTFTAQSVHNGGVDVNGNSDVAGNLGLTGNLTIDGSYRQTAEALTGTAIDLSTGNYFTRTVAAAETFTFTNPPASGTVGSFTVEIDLDTGGSVTWPTEVEFSGGSAPTLTVGKTHLLFFVTDDGGTTYRAGALVNYTD